MTHDTERPNFEPLTANEIAETRRAWRSYAQRNPDSQVAQVIAGAEQSERYLEERRVQREASSPYNDGEPVKATLGNFLAMVAGAAGIIIVGAGVYLEFAALAH